MIEDLPTDWSSEVFLYCKMSISTLPVLGDLIVIELGHQRFCFCYKMSISTIPGDLVIEDLPTDWSSEVLFIL